MKTTSSMEVQIRVMLFKGEVCRLSKDSRNLKVLSGRAWLALDSRDVILERDEMFDLTSSKDLSVVSALGYTPLVLEVLGKARPVTSLLKPAWVMTP